MVGLVARAAQGGCRRLCQPDRMAYFGIRFDLRDAGWSGPPELGWASLRLLEHEVIPSLR